MANGDYEVKKSLLGKPKVVYKCTKCQNGLESDLADAGTTDTCPLCKAQFVVPGQRELKEMQDAEKQAEVERLQELEARHQKAADEKARKEQLATEKARQREEKMRQEDEELLKIGKEYEEEQRAQKLQTQRDQHEEALNRALLGPRKPPKEAAPSDYTTKSVLGVLLVIIGIIVFIASLIGRGEISDSGQLNAAECAYLGYQITCSVHTMLAACFLLICGCVLLVLWRLDRLVNK